MAKQSNNSTATIKGIIYQFLVALEKCFELREGETVYIETFGDVSVLGEGSTQIESKFYKGYLTDLDNNAWNTLNNWLKDEFLLDDFSSLVLLTTQKIKPDSIWYGWNEKTEKQKITILTVTKNKYLNRPRKDKKTIELLDSIFNPQKEERLGKALSKFVIDHNAMGDAKYYESIKDRFSKSISNMRKDKFINSLFGYIINPKTINNNQWSISYSDFTKEVEQTTAYFVETTTEFPRKIQLENILKEDYINNPFVEKIKEIQYEEVIPEAISDYVQARQLIISEFRRFPAINNALEKYEETVLRNFKVKHRLASRNCSSDISHNSKNFFDEMMLYSHGTFYIYSSVPPYFDGGLLHILTDEDTNNITWLLNPNLKNNE